MRLALGVVLVWIGVVALAVNIVAVGAVYGITSAVGTSGVVSTSFGNVVSGPEDIAIIIDEVTAEVQAPGEPEELWSFLAERDIDLLGEIGDLVLIVSPDQGGELAIGTGPASAIDAYLSGSPYSAVVRTEYGWSGRSVPGDSPPPDPQTQGFWEAFDIGQPAQIPAERLDGRTLVILRADGGAPVAATLRVEYRVPQAQEALMRTGITTIVGGALALVFIPLGAWVIAGSGSRRRKH